MKPLGKKQNISNAAWIEAIQCIEQSVSKEELAALTDSTVAEIRTVVANKKAAYAWSAGKDSVVLGKICEMAGVTDSMIGVCNLEYPAFMAWVETNRPEGCEIVNTGQDLPWLSKRPEMLFPRSANVAARWFSIVQHRAQQSFFKSHGIDILVLGRRRADGNHVGAGSNIYTNSNGITRYSPLADWKHEHILAFIHYNNLQLPPIYEWENGYLCGTHPWPARQWTKSEEDGWQQIYTIDPDIVKSAAQFLDGAKTFLGGVDTQ